MLLLVAGYVWVLICAREGVINSEDTESYLPTTKPSQQLLY